MPKASTRQITRACVNCKLRKVKCDSHINAPCTHCVKSGTACVVASDKRSTRPSNSDWSVVNKKLAALEQQLDQVSNQNNHLLDLLRKNNVPIQLPEISKKINSVMETTNQDFKQKYPKPGEFEKIDDEATIFWTSYGPTSIFNENENESENKNKNENGASKNIDTAEEKSNSLLMNSSLEKLNKDPTIISHIKLFFQWFYPDIHMFIPREPFLIDFYHPKSPGQPTYCSKELVYAVCAIGSMVDTKFKDSEAYYNIAKTRLFLNLHNPNVPSLQAFILLGLYDIYRCENNSGWLLTGIGLRIGFNMGFHLSPPLTQKSSELTNKLKSRIYWGCFVIDHVMGLMLGRPPILHIADSTIQESESVPDLEWIKEFNFEELDHVIDVSNPLKAIINLITISDNATNDLFRLYGSYESNGVDGLLGIYNKFNNVNLHIERIESWREGLKPELNWKGLYAVNEKGVPSSISAILDLTNNEKIESLDVKCMSPPKMTHVFYYYIVILSLCRPFIKKNELLNDVNDQNDLILQSNLIKLQDGIFNKVVRCLRELSVAMTPYLCSDTTDKNNQINSKHKKPTILVIYATIIAISTILAFGNINYSKNKENGDLQEGSKIKKSQWLISPGIKERERFNTFPRTPEWKTQFAQLQREKEMRYWFFTLMSLLEQSRQSWKLAEKSLAMVDRKIKSEFGIGFKRAMKAWVNERRIDDFLNKSNKNGLGGEINDSSQFQQQQQHHHHHHLSNNHFHNNIHQNNNRQINDEINSTGTNTLNKNVIDDEMVESSNPVHGTLAESLENILVRNAHEFTPGALTGLGSPEFGEWGLAALTLPEIPDFEWLNESSPANSVELVSSLEEPGFEENLLGMIIPHQLDNLFSLGNS